VEVAEYGEAILFLKRVGPGASDQSYGIHVGRLAGLPSRVVERAQGILSELEAGANRVQKQSDASLGSRKTEEAAPQIVLFSVQTDLIIQELTALDVNGLSPREAIEILFRWKERTDDKT
jgi:DNA mismatch repair protein MutS